VPLMVKDGKGRRGSMCAFDVISKEDVISKALWCLFDVGKDGKGKRKHMCAFDVLHHLGRCDLKGLVVLLMW